MALTQDFFSILDSTEPKPRTNSGTGRTGIYRFKADEVERIYDARRRGVTWDQINSALEKAGDPFYKRPASLSQTVHNAAKAYGIEPPFPEAHKPRGPRKAKDLVTA